MKPLLKLEHKNLAIYEAGFIYCKRYNLNFENFTTIFLDDEFDNSDSSKFNKICKDLRNYKRNESYSLIEITEEEYDSCVEKFNK